MNVRRLRVFRRFALAAGYAILLAVVIAVNVFHLDWWWLLASLPLAAVPDVLYFMLHKRVWDKTAPRPVGAIVTRPITEDEQRALEKRGYTVDNMVVSAILSAPSAADAVTLFEQDLRECMTSEFGLEEMSVSAPGVSRRMRVVVGRADDVMSELLERFHEKHGGS